MSHTPGPWQEDQMADVDHMARQLAQSPDWTAVEVVDEDAGGHVAYCHHSNARLIACAPEMLDALRMAQDAIDLAQAQVDSENDRHNLCKRLVAVKRVIAKAEGRE